jgi:acetaldehyde dehydrogenase (acetylating)
MKDKIDVAIIGPGNIGTDLMYKIMKRSKYMNLKLMAGIYSTSEGLRLASDLGIGTSSNGIDAVISDKSIEIAFDATMASVHKKNAPLLKKAKIKAIDLTPAAVGPYVCPVVNLEEHYDSDNINLITCGAQATVPMVFAVSQVTNIKYAEIVATIASKSAGPGTRQSIDEFTETTAKAIIEVGRAETGKAIIILNPAEPPLVMRNTIYLVTEKVDQDKIVNAVEQMLIKLKEYVPGYRLRMPPMFDEEKITIVTEVEGAGDYLPAYSGNLDLETSAAVAVGDRLAFRLLEKENQK